MSSRSLVYEIIPHTDFLACSVSSARHCLGNELARISFDSHAADSLGTFQVWISDQE